MAKLTSTPCNTVATLQQQTTTILSCKTDKSGSRVTWSFDDESFIIFNGFKERDMYPMSMNEAAGEFNITFRSMDASYAGRYICMEPGSSQLSSAQLTVLGKFIIFVIKRNLERANDFVKSHRALRGRIDHFSDLV